MVSQFTRVSIVYSTICSAANQTKHQSSASLAFVRGIRLWLVNFAHKGPVTRKMSPFDDVVLWFSYPYILYDRFSSNEVIVKLPQCQCDISEEWAKPPVVKENLNKTRPEQCMDFRRFTLHTFPQRQPETSMILWTGKNTYYFLIQALTQKIYYL